MPTLQLISLFKFIFIKKNLVIIILLATIFTQTSCFNSKKLSYFPTLGDTSLAIVNKDFEPAIQTGDILMVVVASLDPTSSALFNSVSVGTGLLVNAKGEIEIPKLGRVLVSGKTKAALSEYLQQLLQAYLKDPVVTIRFMNYRVTVLGEVNKPLTVVIPSERISILEALGQAGDLTVQANRTNILLIHENKGKREFHRINLNNNSLFQSPYYYLQSNDVLYVEPNTAKAYSSTLTQVVLPTVLGVASFLLILLSYLKK